MGTRIIDGIERVDDEPTRLEKLQKSSSKPPKLMRLCKELQQEIHSLEQLALPFAKAKRPTPTSKKTPGRYSAIREKR